MNLEYKDLTIIIPSIDETYSLKQTIEIIISENKVEDISCILIILSDKKSSGECKKVAKELSEIYKIVKTINQRKPYAGGALQDGFDIADSSHVAMMSADLETDPHLIKIMIEESKKNPAKIITVSRWNNGGGFNGYNKIKLYLNYIFQKIIALLYCTNLTDLTYAYRILPTEIVKKINWKEVKHPMFLETALVPIRLKVDFIEVAGKWDARTEGVSQNTFWINFLYIKTALRIRFTRKKYLLKK